MVECDINDLGFEAITNEEMVNKIIGVGPENDNSKNSSSDEVETMKQKAVHKTALQYAEGLQQTINFN